MNKAYRKGYRKENKIVNIEKEKGCIAFRSAGSHSPVDVVSIDHKRGIITLIQCKPDSMPDSQRKKIEESSIHVLPSKVLCVNIIQAGFLTYDLFSSLPSEFRILF